jgi:hypothetical protein
VPNPKFAAPPVRFNANFGCEKARRAETVQRRPAAIASRGMTKVTLVLVMVVLLVAAGGALFLAYWHIDVPRAEVSKVLPDARFPK